VPATEAPAAETPLATQEEVAEAEPVARIDEEQLEAEAAALPVEAAAEEPQTEASATAQEDEPAA